MTNEKHLLSITRFIFLDYNLFQGTISFHDLFMTPTFDELEEVAIDTNGVAKRLDKRQLENVRKFG